MAKGERKVLGLSMELAPITLGENEGYGVVNEGGFFYPNRFYADKVSAQSGLLELARETVADINHRKENRVNAETGEKITKGRMGDYDSELLGVAQGVIDSLAADSARQEVIKAFMAENGLTAESLAEMRATSA